MFLGKPESAHVHAVRQFCRHLQSSWAGQSRFPPRKRNTTLVLDVLERCPKSLEIGRASRHNATEGVSCCVVFWFRNCPGSADGFMRQSELPRGAPLWIP